MKTTFFLLVSLILSTSLFSQRDKASLEKIKALKVAYITEQLNLTSSEAEKFWPIYNKFDNAQRKLRFKPRAEIKELLREKGDINNINDKEAEEIISLKLKNDEALHELEQDFIKKISKVLSYQKILKLQMAEMEFARKLMRKYKRKKP